MNRMPLVLHHQLPSLMSSRSFLRGTIARQILLFMVYLSPPPPISHIRVPFLLFLRKFLLMSQFILKLCVLGEPSPFFHVLQNIRFLPVILENITLNGYASTNHFEAATLFNHNSNHLTSVYSHTVVY